MKTPQHCWVGEGKFSCGAWAPLPCSPSDDTSRRYVRKRVLEWAEKELGSGWRNKDGKLITRNIRVVKYVRLK